MTQPEHYQRQVIRLFAEEFQIDVPSIETDLIDAGLLDSLIFVELIVQLEKLVGDEISLAELDLEQFRSIKQIAEFVGSRGERAHSQQTPVSDTGQNPTNPPAAARQEPAPMNETGAVESPIVAEVRR